MNGDDGSPNLPDSQPPPTRPSRGWSSDSSARSGAATSDTTPPSSCRDTGRAIEDIKTLALRSHALSMDEALDSLCNVLRDAVEISCVVVVHDRALRPLLWATEMASDAGRGRAALAAQRAYKQMIHTTSGDGAAGARPRGELSPGAVTLPLAIPLLGVIRFEGEGLDGEGVAAFLRHATIVVSLTLDRCFNCEPLPSIQPGRRRGVTEPHEVIASALRAAHALLVTLDAAPGHHQHVDEAIRLARAMTLSVIDTLEPHAGPTR